MQRLLFGLASRRRDLKQTAAPMDKISLLHDAPPVIDVQQPNECCEDVNEVLHAVDVAPPGMPRKPLALMPIHKL